MEENTHRSVLFHFYYFTYISFLPNNLCQTSIA